MKNWKARLLFPFVCSSETRAAPTLRKDPLVRETCFIWVCLTFPGTGSNSCAFGWSLCKTLDPGEPWSRLHYCTGPKKKLVHDVWIEAVDPAGLRKALVAGWTPGCYSRLISDTSASVTLQDYLLQSFKVEVHVRKRLHLEVNIIVHFEIHGVVTRNETAVQMGLLLLTFNPNVNGVGLLMGTECALARTPVD